MNKLFYFFVALFFSGCVSYDGGSYLPTGGYPNGYRPAHRYSTPNYQGYGNYGRGQYSPSYGGYRSSYSPSYGNYGRGQQSPYGGQYQNGYRSGGVYAPYGGRWAEYWTAGRYNWEREAVRDWDNTVKRIISAP